MVSGSRARKLKEEKAVTEKSLNFKIISADERSETLTEMLSLIQEKDESDVCDLSFIIPPYKIAPAALSNTGQTEAVLFFISNIIIT